MLSKPYLFSAGGPINDGLKLLIDDGAHDLGPDALTVVPSANARVGVNGFVGTGATRFSTIGTVADLTFPQNVGILTAAAWVRPASVAANIRILQSADATASNGFQVVWIQSVARWQLGTYSTSEQAAQAYRINTVASTPPAGVWTFVAVTWDYPSGIGVFYVNAVSVALNETSKRSLTTGDATNAVHLGSKADGTEPVNAALRGVRLWNRVLSSSEIAYLYETERPAFYR